MKEIGIGLLGFGTVGAGVVEGLQKNGEIIAKRLGMKPVLRRIADLDLKSDRGVKIKRSMLTKDAMSVIHDPAIDVIIELIGGTGIARKFILEALKLGKPVVTANKALLAEYGAELFSVAAKNGTDIWFEASVGGGIPIIQTLREGLIANRIDHIYGILNGTCNYILTRMENENASFDEALKGAQAGGYAEANPSLDIDGIDTAHKAVVLASLAYGVPVPMKSVHIEGIRGVAKVDIENARGLGYRIKLLAVIKNDGHGIEVRVHPTLIPVEHLLASVSGVFNAIFVEGDTVGQTMFYGRGAGRKPTASAVISDVADVCRALGAGPGEDLRPMAFKWHGKAEKMRDIGDIEARYYLRVSLPDKAGMLGRVATILGKQGISIASVIQKEKHVSKHVPVVIVTHRARESGVAAALKIIDGMAVTGAKTICLRIEDLGIEK
jgi:homoserine dehydrogenase